MITHSQELIRGALAPNFHWQPQLAGRWVIALRPHELFGLLREPVPNASPRLPASRLYALLASPGCFRQVLLGSGESPRTLADFHAEIIQRGWSLVLGPSVEFEQDCYTPAAILTES